MSDTPGSSPSQSEDAQLFDRFARFYDADYRYYEDDLQLIVDLAQDFGDPVLELGCGTGRVLVPLAAVGHTVTGVDISPALLDVARGKLDGAPLPGRVTLVEGDMEQVNLPEQHFSCAFCVSNTLMHCSSQAAQLAVLRNAYCHLRPGGALLLDLFNPDVARLVAVNGLNELADTWEDEGSGAQVFKWSVRTLDWAEQLQDTLFIYEEIFPDGRVQRTPCPFSLRFLWRGEGELMLAAAGFRVDAVWGDFDCTPYSSASERLIFLARKA